MLRSLEKLRGGINVTLDVAPDEVTQKIYCEIADDIQAEVDEKYIPRDEVDKLYLPSPLFEDGEPVQIGDEVADEMGVFAVERICYGPVKYCLEGGNHFMYLTMGTRVSRPPKPDSQEKIDADYRNETNSLITDSGRGCMTRERALKYVERFDELMARQRKLDGVE